MPRPCKRRRVCAEPSCGHFGPKDPGAATGQTVIMTLDEFEAIRLIDLEGRTQEQCAALMNVARTTVQAIYSSARGKLAECLVNGSGWENPVVPGGGYQRLWPRRAGRFFGRYGRRYPHLRRHRRRRAERLDGSRHPLLRRRVRRCGQGRGSPAGGHAGV